MTPIVEVEVDGGTYNRDLLFPPLGRRVRGRMDATRAARHDKEATSLLNTWPQVIPGMRLGVDEETGEGYLVEPLHGEEYIVTREVITNRRMKLEPAIKRFPADKPTWLYWLKLAVDSGAAKVTAGALPETIEGQPKTAFVVQRQKSATDKLTEAIDRQTEMFGKLIETLLKSKR
ncbi:MAG TPA: hypothetical protein PK867_31160 [Pirellulales bacterium]|nr:hypothetical protein [Pirellulales bacterium]